MAAPTTIPEVTPAAKRHTANGATLNFSYNFAIETPGDIVVFLDDTQQLYQTHYWLTGVGSTAGGEVQFTFYPWDGAKVTILRAQDIQQAVNLLANSSYSPSTIAAMHNRHTAVDQMLAERIARAPKFLPKSSQSDIPLPEPSSNKLWGWNNASPWQIENKDVVPADSIVLSNNTPLFDSGAGDPGTSTEVSRSDHVHPNSAHNAVLDYGVDNTGATATDVELQAAIDSLVADDGAVLYLPAGTYRLDNKITVTNPIRIIGDSPRVIGFGDFTSSQSYTGTWLLFNHSDIGIDADATNNVTLQGFGTKRIQPTPAAAWAPTAHDFDIVYSNMSDCLIDDLLFLNATKGIQIAAGLNTSGRITIKNCRGQFFAKGIEIESAADVVLIDNFQIEPYWVHDFTGNPNSDEAQVEVYTLLGSLGIALYKCDLVLISNYFAIYVQSGIWVGQNAFGTARKILFSNTNVDFSTYVVFVDAAVDTAWLQFDTLWGQGGVDAVAPSAQSVGIYVLGDNCLIDVGTFNYANPEAYGVYVAGIGNIVRIGRSSVFAYDADNGGFAAFHAEVNNAIFLGFAQAAVDPAGSGPKYSGAGRISVDEWRSFTPTVTSSGGAITAYTRTGRYKIFGNNTVVVQYDIAVSDNGTGTGTVVMTLPFGDPLQMSVGSGKNLTTGAQNATWLDSDNNIIVITKYDGTYPVGTGERITGEAQYQIVLI